MNMRKLVALLLTLLMALVMAACGGTPEIPASPSSASSAPSETASGPTTSAEPVELLISAAASLTDALNEAVEGYKTVAPNVKITVNYGASGALQTQIENGAPADIFFPAANKQMDALNGAGLMVSDSIVKLLKNDIVLVVPADSTLAVASFEDAAGDTVTKIALGDTASVPAGQYAQDTFTSLGLWDKINAKAVFGTDVRQVLSWVAGGDVDCGVVYATDATADGTVKIIASAPADSHKAIVYPVGIVKASTQQAAAAAFIEYLQSSEAKAVFEKYGFLTD
jgi:molybdate transport system substrate-binding protein